MELLHRMPTNETLRPYVPAILDLMFSLLERENEENVLVALRIVIELHKHYRPPLQPEVRFHDNQCVYRGTFGNRQRPGPSFMTLLIRFHGLAANFGFCSCKLYVTRHSMLTRLAQKFGACT